MGILLSRRKEYYIQCIQYIIWKLNKIEWLYYFDLVGITFVQKIQV
jgi:hypothetical protein